MSKLGTEYHEDLRELSFKYLESFGLNPFATHELVMEYIKKMSPQPISIYYEVTLPGETVQNKRLEDKIVEIHMSDPGFVGTVKAPVAGFDKGFLKQAAHAYYKYVRPKNISFLYSGVEVHFRTPGSKEEDKFNIARNIFNPTL